ncbi:MAG TPA: DnaA/Hda family protein, partial [Syntrophobacteraceae bacterium]|nr:DnaA/Hda family protein [Syntrophobacteraceae bacterium]
MDQKCQEIKKELQRSLPKGQYDLWVSTIDFLGVRDGRIIVGCRNRLHMEWLREKLQEALLGVVVRYFPEVQKVEYQIVPEHQVQVEEQSEGSVQANFGELIRRSGPRFNPRFTFDQFVTGNCNQFAYAASMAVANSQQFYNQSVYLLADSGLGKSHLSHAVG